MDTLFYKIGQYLNWLEAKPISIWSEVTKKPRQRSVARASNSRKEETASSSPNGAYVRNRGRRDHCQEEPWTTAPELRSKRSSA
jgi:hypothetical protein